VAPGSRTRSSRSGAPSSPSCARRPRLPERFQAQASRGGPCTRLRARPRKSSRRGSRVVAIAGRMLLKRVMGKLVATPAGHERPHPDLLNNDVTGTETHEAFKHWPGRQSWPPRARLFRTKMGELTSRRRSCGSFPKSLRRCRRSSTARRHGAALPQRYVDLIVNTDSRRKSSSSAEAGPGDPRSSRRARYLEVETPMLQSIPGGAGGRVPSRRTKSARPGHVSCGSRPSFLKRLTVAASRRCSNQPQLQDEGSRRATTPSFTMLEFYEAYATTTT